MRNRNPLVALLALFALLVAGQSQAADLADLKMLPAEADIVVQIDVKDLVATALVTDLLKQAKMNPQTQQALAEMKSKFGVDAEKDLERLTIMFPAKSKTGEALMVINTKTPYKTVLAGLQKEQADLGNKKGMAEKSHAGTTYHVADGVGIAQLGGRLVVGDEGLLKKALAGKGKTGLNGNKGMMTLIDKAAKGGGQLWFAAQLPDAVKKDMAAQNPEMKDIQTVQGSLDLAKGLKLRLDLGANKAAAAKMVAKFNEQIAKAKKEQAGNPMAGAMGLGAIIDGVKAKAVGDNVEVALDLSEAQVNQLKAMAMMMVGMAAAQQKAAPPSPAMPPPQKTK